MIRRWLARLHYRWRTRPFVPAHKGPWRPTSYKVVALHLMRAKDKTGL